MSHVHVHVIHFRWGGGGGGGDVSPMLACLASVTLMALIQSLIIKKYTCYMYVLVLLCVMSWYHYVLCPGTTMCYVLVPLCVVRNRPPNIQASKPAGKPTQANLLTVGYLFWLASPGISATFRAGPWGHLRHTCPWSVPSGLPPVPVYVAPPITCGGVWSKLKIFNFYVFY